MQRSVAESVSIAAVIVLALAVAVQSQDSSTADGISSSAPAAPYTGFNFTGFNGTSNQIIPLDRPNVTTTYCKLHSESALNAYDNTTICIVVGGVAKMLFYPIVDQFSLAQIVVVPGVNTTGAFEHPQIWFQAEFSGVASPIKRRFPEILTAEDEATYGGGKSVVPFWTLIITLKDGLVDKLEWDDGCLGCSGTACIDETCTVNKEAAGCGTGTNTADCNPKFFVSWYGTDRDGVYLTSAGARYSRFREYSLNSAFTQAYQSADSTFVAPTNSITFKPSCSADGTGCET